MALVDPVGKAGGLAVFWKKATNVLDVLSTPFTLELMLNIDNDAGTWWCIFVYASTDDNMRKNQWDFLTNRSKIWGKNKVLIGDFNDIISNDEKWGGRVRPNWTFSDFKGFINNNELLDIGFEGLPWTWSNLWEGDGEIKQRLDRALASEEWCEVFKDARVTHFEVEASDHNILLLETEPRIRKPKRRFHFDSRWLQYREVEGIIQEAWGKNQVGSRGVRISRKIKQCRMNLSAWSRTLKLNSKKEIKRIKEEIHATRSRNGNNAKEAIKMLRKQLSEAYKQEELYWNQRARINWLQKGDKNTAYFHAVVNGRRKRNRITRLEKEQGGWCTTEEEFGEEITQFYNQLFTSSKPSDFDEILNGIPRTITEQMNLQLTRPVTEKEIRIAVFSMHPNKSPGPDANGDEAGHIKEILECYGKASGQQVNINKSAVIFSKNTGSREKEEVLQKLGGIQQVTQGKYLGLPLVVGRSKNSVFRFIKENLMSRLQNWKGKLLSNAGKEVLLKSVATALPSYAMSVFRLSKSLCKELSGLMARFWWGNDQGETRMHWKKWEDIADRKENGGLGFRDLLCFNEALLAKQVWRLITCPNLLVSKVMKNRYFPNSNIFQSKVKAGASWIWQSLHSSIKLLESGIWKQVGDGSTVEIWEDRWLDISKNGRISSPKPNGYQLTKVSSLIKGRKWNNDIIQGLFSKEEAEAIMAIPLSVFQKKDRFKWRFTDNGCYSSKSGYAKAKERFKESSEKNKAKVNSSTNKERSKVWNQLWGLNIKHKIKHFLWKCLHCILPTNEEIFRRTGKGDPLCKCCGEEPETTEHALFHCKSRVLAWATFPVSWDGIEEHNWNFWKWWEHMQGARAREDGIKHIEITANFLWQIWKARNGWNFNQDLKGSDLISKKAMEEWIEFDEAGRNSEVTNGTGPQPEDRQSMLAGLMEQHVSIMYTDAGMNQTRMKAGIGIIAKTINGRILTTWSIPQPGGRDAAELEAIAIRTALSKAIEEDMTSLLILSDCKAVVDRINLGGHGLTSLDMLIEDIKQLSLSFWKCSFFHIRRELNLCSHRLAKFAVNLVHETRWKQSFPVWLNKEAHNDFLAVASLL